MRRCYPEGLFQVAERLRRHQKAKPPSPDTRESFPKQTGGEGRIQFGPQPDSIPETDAAPGSGMQPSSKEGGMPIPPVTPVQPGAPDNLLEALPLWMSTMFLWAR